jgi:myo-inositol 2-dehydrogenase/D-chiro-inositol 1-dehydrogenase
MEYRNMPAIATCLQSARQATGEGGARAMLELCMFAEGGRYQEELSAVGPEGKIEAFVPPSQRFWPVNLGDPPVAQVVVSPRSPKGPRAIDPCRPYAPGGRGSQRSHVLPANEPTRHRPTKKLGRRNGQGRRTGGNDGLAAQESARTGRVVEL